MNRWGCVRVYDTYYGETEYSAVKWIYQLPAVREIVAKIYEEESQTCDDARNSSV